MTSSPGLTVRKNKQGIARADLIINSVSMHPAVKGCWLVIACTDKPAEIISRCPPALPSSLRERLAQFVYQALHHKTLLLTLTEEPITPPLNPAVSGEKEELDITWFCRRYATIDANQSYLLLFKYVGDTIDPMLENQLSLAGEIISLESSVITAECETHLTDKIAMLEEISMVARTGGWEFDIATNVIEWSAQTYRLFGLQYGHSLGVSRSLASFPSSSRLQIKTMVSQVSFDKQPRKHELPYFTARGKQRWARLTARYTEGGEAGRVVGTIVDVSEQRRLSDTEHNFTLYLRTILDKLNDAVLTVDNQGTIITANNAVQAIFGYDIDALIGSDITDILPSVFCCKDIATAVSRLDGLITKGTQLYAVHADMHDFPIELAVSEMMQDGYRQFVVIIKDITERKMASDSIYRMAFFDDVTNLPNIKSFEHDVRKLIEQAREARKDIFCVMLDIDKFSQYNLMYGKEIADYILRVLAQRVAQRVGPLFTIYRGQADRFFVLYQACFDGDDKAVEELLNEAEWELQHGVLTNIPLDGHSQAITASLSSALIEGEKATYEKVVGILEFGRNSAKKQGLSGKVAFDRRAFSDYERHNFISQAFTQALENNEFFLVLQPQYNRDHQIVCSEALLRWVQPNLGMISPGEFIPIAEQSDAIVDIGYWVIDEACRILAHCQNSGVDTRIAINISGRHIVRPDFAEKLVAMVEKWQVRPNQLQLEITETTLVSSISIVRERMEMLATIGFSFSIDDFGTGYSSLSYLKELPISELKIDRYFVDEINFDQQEVPIVNTILDMAVAMNVSTVAEGIENDIQLQYLVSRGCNILQGFHLARPVPVDEWLPMVSAEHYVH